jgi:hypothetical protein
MNGVKVTNRNVNKGGREENERKMERKKTSDRCKRK